MNKFLQLLFALILSISLYAQNTPMVTGSKLSPTQAKLMLEHHNKVRKEVGTVPLVWSNELASYSQRWAEYLAKENNCEMRHRGENDREGKRYGENIFWGSDSKVYKPIDASISWYSEIKDYTYATLSPNNWSTTGHYTQMVWKNTRKMGAGVAFCPSGAIIVVANYDPPGNYMGEAPYLP
jgi:uncharacterized protein YkwD